MSPPITSSLVFDQKVREGLFNYKQADKKVAFATISLPWNSPLNIRQCFREMNRRIMKMIPKVKIQYIGVIIRQIDVENNRDRYHAHIFWRKPFVKFEKLKQIWESVVGGENENFAVSSVTITPKSLDRVIGYCQYQKEEHFPCDVEFFYSEKWGFIPPPVKRKKNEDMTKEEYSARSKRELVKAKKKFGIGRFKDDT